MNNFSEIINILPRMKSGEELIAALKILPEYNARICAALHAPATNIHRSPFSGRNYEYYSEDGLLSGKMASAEVKGMQSEGVTPYVKHFAVNDQETYRDFGGLLTWANEQTMREIYFKAFEVAVEEGGARGINVLLQPSWRGPRCGEQSAAHRPPAQ